MLGNVPVVVVNTASDAKAIFGGHSQALASRPEFYTFHKVSARVVVGLDIIPCSSCHPQFLLLLLRYCFRYPFHLKVDEIQVWRLEVI